MARISVHELPRLIVEGRHPVIVDLRTRLVCDQDSRFIPNALVVDLAEVDRWRDQVPTDREIIFYCTCRNEAGDAYVARKLMDWATNVFAPCLGARMPEIC